MGGSELQQQKAAARAYEDLFVQSLFGAWAPQVLEAADVQRGDHVLDVACGTGILARTALARTGPEGAVAGLDPGPGMIAVAQEIESRIDWREGPAEDIPFPDDSFDAVVSQFGMMFFSDRSKAIAEMHRVLKPAGRMAVLVWDGLDKNPAYGAEVNLLQEAVGPEAADALRAPFVLGDEAELLELFDRTGVASAAVSTYGGRADFPSIRTMVEADLRGWLPAMGVHVSEEKIAHVLEEAERVLAPYSDESGRARFDVSAHLITAGSR